MKTFQVYRNHGVIGAEKVNNYTFGNPNVYADCWEVLTVEVPQNWETAENEAGSLLLVSPDGQTYLPGEVLAGTEGPVFKWINRDRREQITGLHIVSIDQ